MKKFISLTILSVFIGAVLTGCTSEWNRSVKDMESNFSGGLNRIINIYSLDGNLIASHEGKVDIEDRENSILFDLNGKRYIYYNAIIEVLEK